MRLEHHLVGGYVRYISPHIIIIIKNISVKNQNLNLAEKTIHTGTLAVRQRWFTKYMYMQCEDLRFISVKKQNLYI